MPKPGNERSAAFKVRRGNAWADTTAPFSWRSFCLTMLVQGIQAKSWPISEGFSKDTPKHQEPLAFNDLVDIIPSYSAYMPE
jgi:hypothetical protein